MWKKPYQYLWFLGTGRNASVVPNWFEPIDLHRVLKREPMIVLFFAEGAIISVSEVSYRGKKKNCFRVIVT